MGITSSSAAESARADRALEIDTVQRRSKRNGLLFALLGALAIVASWWLLPQAIVAALTTTAPLVGTVNILVSVVLFACGITLIVVGTQTRLRAEGIATLERGKANSRFDEAPTQQQGAGSPVNFAGMNAGSL